VRPETNHSITLAEKLAFFTETRHAYGRSALLLSGGGSLGLLHAGVVKCLHESLLLPRVLAGSSVGSILCGMLGTRTADEIDYMLSEEKDAFDLNFFDPDDSLFMGIRRFATTGYCLDGGYLMASSKRNIPPLTFQEAYDRTGRIINIVVSPSKRSGNSDRYRLLNYLTAPHVFITSAVIASCAIPGVYAPVELMAKDEDGHAVPYIEHDTVKWEDGSMQSDLPMHRLGELFNINNFIVSQVNPHILPFIHLLPEHMLSSSQILQGQDPSLMSLLVDPISKMILFLLMELR
jgi:TAG lipase / steryl ester hydrolase / phospholipase A2 / LPA acyltransferase